MTFSLSHLMARITISASKKCVTLPNISVWLCQEGHVGLHETLTHCYPGCHPTFVSFSNKHLPRSCHTERNTQAPGPRPKVSGHSRPVPARALAATGPQSLSFPRGRGTGHLPESVCPFHPEGACSFPCDGKGESSQTWR